MGHAPRGSRLRVDAGGLRVQLGFDAGGDVLGSHNAKLLYKGVGLLRVQSRLLKQHKQPLVVRSLRRISHGSVGWLRCIRNALHRFQPVQALRGALRCLPKWCAVRTATGAPAGFPDEFHDTIAQRQRGRGQPGVLACTQADTDWMEGEH